jgi:RNA polymerase sigma-70 factor (ECF subfamily)
MSDDLDAQLLARWQQGDQQAGDALVSRHFASVHGFMRGRLPESDVRDLVHQTFLACLQHPERFEGRASFRTYLLAIARNQLVSHWRRREVERGAPVSPPPDEPTSPSGRIARHEQQRLLLRALRRLPLDLQLTLELHYWEEMPTADIAIVMDALPATVRTRLSRARALLAEQIRLLGAEPSVTHNTITNLEDWARSLRADSSPRTPDPPSAPQRVDPDPTP